MKPLKEFVNESKIDNSKIENLLDEIFDNYSLGYDAAEELTSYLKKNFNAFKNKTDYFIKIWLNGSYANKDHTVELYDVNREYAFDLVRGEADYYLEDDDKEFKAYIENDGVGVWIPNEIGEKFANKINEL